jgi:aryl-alcohol dehydrogenase-like predicted oxidoreductase
VEISTEKRPLGDSGITVPALGLGTNRWGGGGADQSQLDAAYAAALDAGLGFLDTAEVYNAGKSEKSIRSAAARDTRQAMLASKFAPYPHRLTPGQLSSALDKTLDRLGVDSIDLYYLHFPFSPVGVGTWMKPMAKAVKDGKIRAVGISNCNVAQMRKAASVLGRFDIPLAANQVHYSVLNRKPEKNGVLDACREMDVALVAYRPIGGGSIGSGSARGRADLAGVLEEVAGSHGATSTQVALAWLLKRDEHVIPIPGATKPAHVRENAGAMTLRLSEEEFVAIDSASR